MPFTVIVALYFRYLTPLINVCLGWPEKIISCNDSEFVIGEVTKNIDF